MKALPYLLAGAAGLGLYLLLAKSAGDPNPWRGTGTPCERDFDAKSPADKQAVLDRMKTMDATSHAALMRCERP
jgi:hypothetical protein